MAIGLEIEKNHLGTVTGRTFRLVSTKFKVQPVFSNVASYEKTNTKLLFYKIQNIVDVRNSSKRLNLYTSMYKNNTTKTTRRNILKYIFDI